MILGLLARKIVLCVLLIGLLASPVTMQDHHGMLSLQVSEAERHAVLAPVVADEHGHSHDDGEDHEKSSEHKHGHDPADHSHQVVMFSNAAWADVVRNSDTPVASVPDLVRLETAFSIERPPKTLASV